METGKILLGKKVLIVDDEKDVLEVLIDLLSSCKIDTASSFEEAKRLLERNRYDMAILDIMGVDGFRLLGIAKKKSIPAIMLTAHALNEESLGKSIENGASYFVPKDKINEIDVFVADVLEAREKGKNPWFRWLRRLGSTFDAAFTGPEWRERQKEFLESLKKAGW